jgi:cell division protein FtsW (lipid II flippase)/cell division protein FtsI/penicillin-binding protein 2
MKPGLLVRTPSQYVANLILWGFAFLAAFYLVHAFWVRSGFAGEQLFLPALHALTGIGFVLMISLRDPLRDTLIATDFAQGVIAGCLILAAASTVDYDRATGPFSYTPLVLSFGLSVALIVFGTGPGASDAKVNLFGFQPVELIKLLTIFFLAGYFARNWELLRVLRQRHPRIPEWMDVPRTEYALPVVLAVAITLAFFFLQKDLGPALIICSVFLLMYAAARNRYFLSLTGFAVLASGFAIGYLLGAPRTVAQRVQMWLSPWENTVRGGDQIAHSMWSMATGAIFGTGPGMGDPQTMPAAHTDLILAGLGEEWGFVGLSGTLILYATLVYLAIRTSLRARTDYSFFLGLGIALLTALHVVLIACGVFGLLPLSGVATPFLSYGRTSMLANFAAFGVLAAISSRATNRPRMEPFLPPIRTAGLALAALCLVIMAKAAYVQVVNADAVVGAGALTPQADGERRFAYNPRLYAIIRSIPRGTIYDRNGLPLAASDWDELQKHREDYRSLGIQLDGLANRTESRFYPLGAATVHLLGDLRTRANWSARNSSLAERDSAVQLQGYDDRAQVVAVENPNGRPAYTVRYDYRELVPLLRHRFDPEHESVRRIVDRDRSLRLTIDARLQVRSSEILAGELQRLRLQKGAIVVLSPDSGDVLASVSVPWPSLPPRITGTAENSDEMLDRARYGLYPPGSTFKLVTATAALRKDLRLADEKFECTRLPDGRIGNHVRGWRRPVRDDIADRHAHGLIDMHQATIASCNAWFAQLAAYKVGANQLHQTASLFRILVANPNEPSVLKDALPQAGYGQGQVVATPLQMARVAATFASGGSMPLGRWVVNPANPSIPPPIPILSQSGARRIASYMRDVVTKGTARSLANLEPAVAGKTGTAEVLQKPSHAWFVGFAPYGGAGRKIAVAVIIEHGRYGGAAAAPVAGKVVAAASELGLINERINP